jgi:hypothetical protein
MPLLFVRLLAPVGGLGVENIGQHIANIPWPRAVRIRKKGHAFLAVVRMRSISLPSFSQHRNKWLHPIPLSLGEKKNSPERGVIFFALLFILSRKGGLHCYKARC